VSSIGFALAVAAPTAELLEWAPVASLGRTAIRATGAVTVLVSIAASFAAQLAMGESWRADVDPDARTDLVTTGPFRWVRNPVFTATGAVWIGLVALVPHPLFLGMVVASLLAIEIQVRWAEEPYLQRVHGSEWREYAARTGRFVPGLGRVRRS
jgi:protein-S-isoprenylcysteine O-methyltransferase Ste14